MNLDLCQHQAASLVEALLETNQTLKASIEDWSEIATNHSVARDEGLAREAELHAEINGMNAGARLDATPPYQPEDWANFSRLASNMSDAISEWVRQINGRLNAVENLNSIDGETVRLNLIPFINTVEGWKDLLDTTVNYPSREEN